MSVEFGEDGKRLYFQGDLKNEVTRRGVGIFAID